MISETKRKATWQELADRVDELQEKLDNSINKDKFIEAIDFAINATDSTDDYSIGLCNGMIYVKALLTDRDPDYKKCQNNEAGNTYEFGLIVGTKRERDWWQNKIREKIEELEKTGCTSYDSSTADYVQSQRIGAWQALTDLIYEVVNLKEE